MQEPVRAYCRRCDRGVDAEGPWPGRCATCGTPTEEHPVPDVVRPGLDVLFVGINPGVQTARARRHFANPHNAFWGALAASGLTPRRLDPSETDALLALGLGVTNVVTRATPGSSDVTREDVLRGRPRLEALVREARPGWVAFVGKEAYRFSTGIAKAPLGEQEGRYAGARAFVLPSTSPANAAIAPAEKTAWFRRLRDEITRP